jgi:hypothetical protein
MYFICYAWDDERQQLNWGIHDGVNYIKRGFKTRKKAREYCNENKLEYQK